MRRLPPEYESKYHQESPEPCPFCGSYYWTDFLIGDDMETDPCAAIGILEGYFYLIKVLTTPCSMYPSGLHLVCECIHCGATASL